MKLKGKEKRQRRRQLRRMVKSGEITKAESREIKNQEFRNGRTALGKILTSYVAPAAGVAVGVAGVAVGLKALGGLKKVVAEKKMDKTTISKTIEKIDSKTAKAKSLVDSVSAKSSKILGGLTNAVNKAKNVLNDNDLNSPPQNKKSSISPLWLLPLVLLAK